MAVSGDITEDRLGLCPEEENLLAQTVTAILRTINDDDCWDGDDDDFVVAVALIVIQTCKKRIN